MPKVSVIVPNYNHARFLHQRLDSILNQTFQDFEVILLDDFSTDNSIEVLKEYSENPKVIHFVINDKNSGSPFAQWQKGIQLARGEYIWIAESDDVADITFLERLMPLFTVSSNTVLAYCATEYIDENSQKLGLNKWAYELDPLRWQTPYYNNGMDEIKYFLRYRNTIPNASGVVFKKSASQCIKHVTRLKMRYSGDWMFWVSVVKQGDIIYTPDALNYMRNHMFSSRAKTTGKNELKRVKDRINVIEYASNILDSKFSWKSEKYIWFFQHVQLRIEPTLWNLIKLSIYSDSLSFLTALIRNYKK